MTYIEQYYNAIKSGEVIVGDNIKKIYEKLYNKLTDNSDGFYFDEEEANRPIEFIETFIKHSKGKLSGKPVKLMLWQKAFLQALYGFIDEEGYRQYKEILMILARKNGKSFLASAIQIYECINQMGAEVYSLGSKLDQAKIVFTETTNMVNQSKSLSKHFKKRKTDLYMPKTFSKIQPLASDSNSLDGLNSSCSVFDEIHAYKNRNLVDVMKQSSSARDEFMFLYISTAGFTDGTTSVYDTTLEYALNVLSEKVKDDRFLPILYLQDNEKEVWEDEESWYKSNPGLGEIKKLVNLKAQVERAKVSPSERRTTLVKDFNIRQNETSAFLNWDELNNEETFDIYDVSDCYCVGGFDLSQTDDLTCAGMLIKKDGKYYYYSQYFLPADLIDQKAKETGVPWDVWRDQGYITPSGTTKIDYSDVSDWFLEMQQKYNCMFIKIGYDPYSAVYLIKDMKENGFDDDYKNGVLWKCRQGIYTMSQPMKQMGIDLKNKLINYDNNPVTKFCLTNLAVKTDINNNIQPVKNGNQNLKIDGAVVMAICFATMAHNTEAIGNLMD